MSYFNLHLINPLFSRLIRFQVDDKTAADPDAVKKAAEDKVAADAKEAQEKLDKQFAERAARAEETGRKKLLEELGITDPVKAKELLEKAIKADEASKDALTKAEEARLAAETKAEKAEADAKVKEEAATRKLMDSDIKIAAVKPVLDNKDKKKVLRPAFREDALADVLLVINREGITEKDGEFSGVDKALEALAKAKPWLLETETAPVKRTTPNPNDKTRSRDETDKRIPIIRGL